MIKNWVSLEWRTEKNKAYEKERFFKIFGIGVFRFYGAFFFGGVSIEQIARRATRQKVGGSAAFRRQ
jgi:hypothetical protein